MRGDRDGASVSGYGGNWAGCPTLVFQRVGTLTSPIRHPPTFHS
jgi:hypothetical protein